MAKTKKSQSISKQTTSKKSNKVSKQKQINDNKSKSALQPVRKLNRLKSIEKPDNPIEEDEEEEEVGLSVNFGTIGPFLQSVVLCHILENHFSLFEQIEMRRVCRLWHYNVKHIWAKTRSLVLTLKGRPIKPKLAKDLHKPKPINRFFPPQMVKGLGLSIGKNHWNHATIDLLGDLFRNIEHLTINNELYNAYDDIPFKLAYFLQKFAKVKSFSLTMPQTRKANVDFLSRLFKTINDNLAPLNTLHLNIPNYTTPYSAVDIEHFHKTLPYLQNFSFNSTVENLSGILQCMGKSFPARWPIQSLSINVGFDKLLSPVETLFEQNPNLSYMKRLELTGLGYGSLDIASRLLVHFTELKCLNLCATPHISGIAFTYDWIETLSKLPHLKELYLWNVTIQIFNAWPTRGLDEKSLPNIRKLTIFAGSYNLYGGVEYKYCKIYNLNWSKSKVEAKSIYGLYLYNLAKQFPKLEQLIIKLTQKMNKEIKENFSDWCFAEFKNLKSARLIDNDDSIYP